MISNKIQVVVNQIGSTASFLGVKNLKTSVYATNY